MKKKSRFILSKNVPVSRGLLVLHATLLLICSVCGPVWAQAPSVTYYSNVGAPAIGVDSQTNVYASSGGKVYVFNAAGVPVQTNQVCPAAVSMATRDDAGNLYFTGNYSPPQSFGTVTLTTNEIYYLAKYSSAGVLTWVVPFGPSPNLLRGNTLTDLRVDSGGNVYVGYYYFLGGLEPNVWAAKFSSTGTNLWAMQPPQNAGFVPYSSGGSTVRFGPLSPTNGYLVRFDSILGSPTLNYGTVGEFDVTGTTTAITNLVQPGSIRYYDRPSGSPAGEWFSAEAINNGNPPLLVKRGVAGAQIWSIPQSAPQWILAADSYGGVHVADDNANLLRYDYDGNLVWTLTMPALVSSMLLDAQGNRFFSLTSGVIGRLGAEPVFGPSITNSPQGLTILAGSNALFTAGATGSGPLRYSWQLDGQPLSGATNTTLSLTDVQVSQGGQYTFVASNFVNVVTSAPALLRVRSVAIFSGSQILTNGTYVFGTPPTLSVGSAFTNGTVFYTLDGSPPTFSSPQYTGPFVLSNSAPVRALGYSFDFSQSQEADIVTATVFGPHTLTATTAGGGSVSLNPPGGTYSGTNVVTATATPASGYTFLYWQGDASGYNPQVSVSMERDKTIVAVFGTTLSTVPSSGGQIQAAPPGGPYPYGSVVRLTAVPQSGNYFAVWGGSGGGTANPLYFTISNANPTVSALFQPTSSSQAALTVLLQGPGQVNVNPNANVYSTNANVTLTANPAAGKGFVSWSGDASGSQNPLTVAMTQNKIITAIFTNWPGLLVNRAAGDGPGPEGFRFTIISGTQMVYQVFASSNLSTWDSVGLVTNATGTVQFTDPGATNRPSSYYKVLAQ